MRDRLGLEAGETVSTTWSFHFRLLRALADDRRTGRLTRAAGDAIRSGASARSDDLLVIDPRLTTALAAAASLRHRLNVLAAELVAAAAYHDAEIVLSEGNVGRSWPDVFAEEGLRHRVV
ncbi:MAG: hypothetical protein ACR2MB_17355 [Acidimicrobiales bacterium]